MHSTQNYHVIGMMSGTSLDGIDLSLAKYLKKNQKWTFQILACKTFAYDNNQVRLLKELENQKLSFLEFKRKQIEYSQIIVEVINKFLLENKQKIENINIDAIGLHGHTIFHNPKEKITVQVGNLQFIAAQLRTNVVGNFRELDIHRGGQGAPLAPFGQQLFGDFVYLNFGGIANVGYKGQGYDIVFCNMVLNKYSQKIQCKLYDQNGEIGSQGQIDRVHLEMLNKKFNNMDKHSLAREEIQQFLESIEKSAASKQELKNNMRTFYEFIVGKIIQSILSICADEKEEKIEVYCTGGGAFNKFLIESLNRNKHNISFTLPHVDIINFKQALIFGLLSVKFMQGQKNCSNGIGGELVKGKWNEN